MPLNIGLDRMRRSRAAVPLAIVAAAALLVVSELGFRRTEVALARHDRVLTHRIEVARLQRLVLVAESSQRGYLMTGRPAYKQPYSEAMPQLEQQLRTVEQLYAEEPDMRADVQRLAELVRRKVAEMQTTVDMFDSTRSNQDSGWRELMLTDIGRETMVEFDSIARRVTDEETRRLDAAGHVLDDTLRASRIGIAAMVLLSLVVLLALMANARRLADERALRLQALGSERDRLDAEVQHRTTEITEIARHLQSAREDERGRLARELHDELGGLLTAAKLDVARLRNKLGAAPPDLLERLKHLVQTLDAGIALKRRIIENLHPSSLSNLGLKAALEILCDEFAEGSQIEMSVAVAELRLDKAAELTIYRLVQEALTNAAKYARARHIAVSLAADATEVTVQVQDDGCGFDPAATPGASHGLAGMRFRVQSEQGRLMVRSAPGAGTTITARLPLKA
jgi:signal transduction histidine kinase